MNLQRREEIRELANWLDSSEWSGATEYQDAMREMLAHIDTLEQRAAERVIADGRIAQIHDAVGRALSDPSMAINETALHDALGGEFDRIGEIASSELVIARGAAVKPHTFAEIINQVRDIANKYAGTEQLRERIVYAIGPYFVLSAGPTPDYTGEGSAWVPPVEALAVAAPEIMLSDISDECSAMLCDDREAFRRGALWAQKFITSRLRAIPADRVLGDGMLQVEPGLLMLLDKALESCKYAPQHVLREAIRDAIRANQGGAAT